MICYDMILIYSLDQHQHQHQHLQSTIQYNTIHIDGVVISAEVGYRKPDSRIFQLVLDECWGKTIERSEVVVVGDMINRDVLGARRMGMKSILLTMPEWDKPANQKFLSCGGGEQPQGDSSSGSGGSGGSSGGAGVGVGVGVGVGGGVDPELQMRPDRIITDIRHVPQAIDSLNDEFMMTPVHWRSHEFRPFTVRYGLC